MRVGGRLAAVVLVCCAVGLGGASALGASVHGTVTDGTAAGGTGVSTPGEDGTGALVGGSGSPSPLGSLVVPGVQALDGAQQAWDQQLALRANPASVLARQRSRTAFRGLGAARAALLAKEAFPQAIDDPAGGLSGLPAGQKIVGYPSDMTARVDLGGGKHGVIESFVPIATEVSPDHRRPIDLGLSEDGSAFQLADPVVGVRIPKRLSQGVQLSGSHVSLTPVDAQGAPLGGSAGEVDGATVLYTNTQTDMDTVVKPTTGGFAADTLLRSVDSPRMLYFRVGLPAGASLVRAQDSSGLVQVVRRGKVIAAILPPGATDAAGTPVPVSVSVRGDVLALAVSSHSGEYQYPIEVDPTVADHQVTEFGGLSNWREEPAPPSPFEFSEFLHGGLTDFDQGKPYARGEWGAMAYETAANTHIYGFITETTATNAGANIENKLFIESAGGGVEKEQVLGSSYATTRSELCVLAGCATGTVTAANEKNAVEFKQTATNPGSAFESWMTGVSVDILQEKGPAIGINTTEATIGGKPNIFYPGVWAGPNQISEQSEAKATDPGLGIYEFHAKSPNKAGWAEESKYPQTFCKGVQCLQSFSEKGFSAWELPSGEDTIEISSVDPVGLTATASAKVKVDFSLPYGIVLSGLPVNKELGNGQYKLKATAKDGTTIESSGVASIALSVDGKEIGAASGSCRPGPCTATSNEWTISGTEFPAGQHKVTVTATSYAGDVAKEEYTVDTGHIAAPVALGPGSVSPQTGEFFLNAADVSIGAPGGGLSVKRSYSSSHLAAGAEGPLGPQWSMTVGGAQSLTKATEGSIVLTAPGGEESVFTSKGKGEFTSPPLSASLTLTEVGSEFVLKSTDGTITKFKLPSGGTGNTYVPATLEGPGATNVVTYSFKTVGTITEPTEVLAPVPAGVSCATELVKGCRALGFVYASKTTAKGDGLGELGDYEGRLKEVTLTAWDPASSKMKTVAVADYSYDKEGKLRGEWNPNISPALEMTYGYDAAGHVTAMAPPGQQPWLFNYGTTAGDVRTRIVSVTQPSASTAHGTGVAPVNTAAPVLSTTTPVEGVPLSVTNGTWSNSPLSYSYQWETCGTAESKETCTPIYGATNQTFSPGAGEGYIYKVLVGVKVTATNSDGSTTVSSAKSGKTTQDPSPHFEEKREFGTSGGGILSKPANLAVDSSENVWVADTGNNRIVKFSSAGAYLASYGSTGSGERQFKEPKDVITGREGDVFVADTGNSRIEVLDSTGKYVTSVATTGAATGIALGAIKFPEEEREYLYAVEPSKNDIQIFQVNGIGATVTLTARSTFGEKGVGAGQFNDPTGIATGPRLELGNSIYVSDTGDDRVEALNASWNGKFLAYSAQIGKEGIGGGGFLSPGNLALEPSNLKELREEHFKYYDDFLANAVFVSDATNNLIQQFATEWYYVFEKYVPADSYVTEYGMGKGAEGIAFSAVHGEGAGDMYVANTGESKISEWAPGPVAPAAPEPPNPGTSAVWTVDYHVPLSGAGLPTMTKTELEKSGQKDDPTEATAIFPPDEPMGWPAKDYKRASIIYLDANARTVNTESPGGAISTTEYNAKNDVERTLSADNRALALSKGSKSVEVSKQLDTENTYNVEGTELQSSLGPQHNIKLPSGTLVEARHHTLYGYDEGAPTEGGPYGLPTKIIEGALYSGKEEDIRETTTSYAGQENLGWKLHKPTSVVADPKGLKLTHTTVYEPSTGEVKETVMPAGNPKEKTPHATEMVYYTTAKNSTIPACGEHPEWANLPCQTRPAKQPETSGLPNLPEATTTYNIWDEPEKITEAVGSTTRTKTATYDAAGRLKTSAASSTVGTALPMVTDEYNTETGALVTQSTEEKAKKLTSVYNALGELTSYTDADGNTATYNYDIDGRVEKVNDGKGTQTYTYDPTTGFTTKLVDSAGGTFTGSYDVEGDMLTEGYPNGMTAHYAYDQTGRAVGLEYVKTTHCTEKCTWFSDTVVPSIHGQLLSQTSTLSSQSYAYDTAGRLTQVQNTPAGKGCTTRIYAYDEDTNRTSLTTREPGAEGKCATEGGTAEKHTYDSADRLHDTGVAYSTFGDITALPAADAGGSELTSAYYVDNQLQSETQNGETIGFNLDPAGRTRETVSTGKKVSDVINHYAGPGSSPAWTVNTSGEWTRNIAGLNGGLAETQNNGETPVLQLTNLHGDIVATAYLSETATALASTADTSEFGVPTNSLPPKYSWLGANEIPTELPSGVIDMGARSYVPQLGRFLQPDPIPGGSANAYTYTFGDPVNSSDPSGALTYGFSGWLSEANNQQAQEVVTREVARETLEREEAERREAEARAAEESSGPQYAGEEYEEYEEYEEEEGEEEYASYHHETKPGDEENQVGDTVLYQPLDEGNEKEEADASEGSGIFHDVYCHLEWRHRGCGTGVLRRVSPTIRPYSQRPAHLEAGNSRGPYFKPAPCNTNLFTNCDGVSAAAEKGGSKGDEFPPIIEIE